MSQQVLLSGAAPPGSDSHEQVRQLAAIPSSKVSLWGKSALFSSLCENLHLQTSVQSQEVLRQAALLAGTVIAMLAFLGVLSSVHPQVRK
jgi:hypothetical protein